MFQAHGSPFPLLWMGPDRRNVGKDLSTRLGSNGGSGESLILLNPSFKKWTHWRGGGPDVQYNVAKEKESRQSIELISLVARNLVRNSSGIRIGPCVHTVLWIGGVDAHHFPII